MTGQTKSLLTDQERKELVQRLAAESRNMAMMLRRMIWMAEKETGDSSMKALAGAAKQLLASYGFQGSPLRSAGTIARAAIEAALSSPPSKKEGKG